MNKNDLHSKEWLPLFVAWIIALISTLSVLFIGEVMEQAPCLLCWYQRIFMFPLAIILGLAVFRDDAGVWFYALPLAVLGWFVSAYHTLLFFGVIPEPIKPCTETGPSCSGAEMMIFGFAPIPLLSLFSFSLIVALLLVARRRIKS